jgi:hypothetical protein
MKVIGWTLRGSYYRNGFKFSGATILHLSDGSSAYYAEDTSLDKAIQDIQESKGVDTTEAREKIAHWVKTGEGAVFSLEE